MKVTIIEITEKPEIRGPKRKHRLEEQVREAACNCSEEVWIALLENAGCRQSPPEGHGGAGRPR